jgi:flagellar biosynthetic protein FliR
MHGEMALSNGMLLGFLLTLVRVSGVFLFVPLPGVNSVLSPARVMLSMGMTIALFPEWPNVANEPSIGLFILWILVEASLGIGIGLAVAFISEALLVGAQTMGLQAGYGFATTIDPNSQADSTVLVTFAQLAAGLLFFATGLDREVLRIFARSLELYPAGSFVLTRGAAMQVLKVGSAMFSTGLRLALPMIAVLTMIDISLALLGRVNAQLQLLTIAFPVKMIVALMLLGWLALLFPVLFRAGSGPAFVAARGLLVH